MVRFLEPAVQQPHELDRVTDRAHRRSHALISVLWQKLIHATCSAGYADAVERPGIVKHLAHTCSPDQGKDYPPDQAQNSPVGRYGGQTMSGGVFCSIPDANSHPQGSSDFGRRSGSI